MNNNKKYTVKLTSSFYNSNHLLHVKTIKELTGMSLRDAKNVIDALTAGGIYELKFETADEARRAVPALTDVGMTASYAMKSHTFEKLEYLRNMIEDFDRDYKGPVAGRKSMKSIGDIGYIDNIMLYQKNGKWKLSAKDVDRLNKMYHYYKKNMLSW